MMISGWGRFPVLDATVHQPRSVDELRSLILTAEGYIARGSGRAYGDSAINTHATLQTHHLNHLEAFDPQAGQVVAESGVLLADLIAAFLPRGWFPMVTPGTKFVTLGGAIAADVHGKNHHKDGSFRSCVDWIDVMRPDGQIERCSPTCNPQLFDFTLGGMGLTGIILRAAIRMRAVQTAWIRQTTIVAPHLHAAMSAFEKAKGSTYSVAWIDCLSAGRQLGRSLVMLGEHAPLHELDASRSAAPLQGKAKSSIEIPFDFPSVALNGLTVRAFNAAYYAKGSSSPREQLVDWDTYFYPLDAILGWNKIYGRRGFMQFQCVLPLNSAEAGLAALLTATSKAGAGSFLAVLKRFGKQESAFSFPMEGYTLALDFPVSRATLELLDILDRITLAYGGRFYLAKDSRMSLATLNRSDLRVEGFRTYRRGQGYLAAVRSAQSERLGL